MMECYTCFSKSTSLKVSLLVSEEGVKVSFMAEKEGLFDMVMGCHRALNVFS